MSAQRLLLTVFAGLLVLSGSAVEQDPSVLDFTDAVVVLPAESSELGRKAARVLGEEIEKRTGRPPGLSEGTFPGTEPAIVVGLRRELQRMHPILGFLGQIRPPGAEGYTVAVLSGPRPLAVVAGEDPRGVLYGVGRFLREASWSGGRLSVPEGLRISTAPRFPLRGHQLGNRDVNNTYDAWTAREFEQYIRDLALFGANSIELIPPDLADYPTDRPVRRVPEEEVFLQVVDIIDSYGMDVWIFYPNNVVGREEWFDPDDALFQDPDFIRQELESRETLFRKLKRLDALFVPAGDPGSLSPDAIFEWLPKVARVLEQYHPKAKIWVSDQIRNASLAGNFFEHVNRKPEWLGGVVSAPWGTTTPAEMRSRVDASIPMRRYPDISHVMACQYPILMYDRAFALTLGREPIAPRPLAFRHIHNLFDEYAVGSIAYSEGVTDDVNKFVWLDLDWDPERPVMETLRDYARLFVDSDHVEEIARGLLALESNLGGSLAENQQVEVTFQQWRQLEAVVRPEVASNYRFQMPLLRAYYDWITRKRLVHEKSLEDRALGILERAPREGSYKALREAREVLESIRETFGWQDYRDRCAELADQLRENIGVQLSVERHGAIRADRAAIIDALDDPLTDEPYWLVQMERIARLESEPERLRAIHGMLHRTDPGPGNLYFDFGDFNSVQLAIMPADSWGEDPGTYHSARRSFTFGGRRKYGANFIWDRPVAGGSPAPLAWFSHLSALFDAPLQIRVENLDPEVPYRIRVVYPHVGVRMRLHADEYGVHDLMEVPANPVLEFEIPAEATRDGKMILSWNCGPEHNRTSVAEVWLIRETAD